MDLPIEQIDGKEYVKHAYPAERFCKEIGNPSLKRNRVFQLTNNKILKVYGSESRWFREVSSLNFLQSRDINTPILCESYNHMGYNWVVIMTLPGITMAEWLNEDCINKGRALHEMGLFHAKYHELCRVDYYGDWNSIMEDESYHLFIKRFHSKSFDSIRNNSIHDQSLFYKCFSLIDEYDTVFDYRGIFTLCHNDFDARNIIVDSNSGTITGLIDYESSFFAQPLFDMTRMLLLDNLEAIGASAYLHGYEEYSGCEIDRSQLMYYLLLKGIDICSWSHDVAPDYYHKAKRLLKIIANNYF